MLIFKHTLGGHMKKLLLFTVLFLALLWNETTSHVYADELTPKFTLSNGKNSSSFTDTSHSTTVSFNQGDTITITASNGSPIHSIYISWDSEPVAWTLMTEHGDIPCGTNGFLHEYVILETPSTSVTIQIPQNSMSIDGIRIFNEGALPHDVQVWNPPCERADIMVVSSHADDEILFFGGVLPTYAYLHDATVQVVYMCEFRTTNEKVREHEKLDGLWEAGIRFYPTCGNFYDKYSKNVETAKNQYKFEELVTFLVAQIRKFQPQVVVTHDIYGEYGHGFHILTCYSLLQAIEDASNPNKYETSATLYGTWNTPKTYLHIFPVNSITLDLHIPIEEDYEGRTALDILKKAFKKHASQQYGPFYVSDTYEHSCAKFGLYRSLVGPDTTNDLLCNLKTYAVQEQEELERIEAQKLAEQQAEQERLAKEEEERNKAEQLAIKEAKEQQMAEENARIQEEKIIAYETEILQLSNKLEDTKTSNLVFMISTSICLLVLIGTLIKKFM